MAEQVSGLTYVTPPTLEQPGLGLYSVAQTPTIANPHELMGVVYESEAAFLGKFVDLVPESCLETQEKEFEGFAFEYGQLVGHLYAGVTCQPFGQPEEFSRAAAGRLDRSEEFLAERFLWEQILTYRSTDLNPAGALSVSRGIGVLLEWAAQNYLAKPTLHYGRLIGSTMARYGDLVDPELAKQVNGRGYYSRFGAAADVDEVDAPVLTLGATGAGGTFAADDYFWVITAINALGETVASNEVTATLALNDQQVLNWAAVTGATGYKVYRGTVTGAEDTLVATLGAVITYTDTGIAGTAGEPPTANTTAGESPVQSGANDRWMYVTGEVVIRRSDSINVSAVDVEHNVSVALAERSIIPTVDVIVGAVRITLE
jgi:hypothetical protein